MKTLNTYISEGFFQNVGAIQMPKDKYELVKIINDTISKQGPNCDLNFIDISNIDDLSAIFANKQFNGDISNWNVSNVRDMSHMFSYSVFTGDISKWDTSNVEYMDNMFHGSKFDGDISNWDVSNVEYMDNIFHDSKIKKLDKLPNWYK